MDRTDETVQQLVEGNRRFVSGEMRLRSGQTDLAPDTVAAAQSPFAVVLGCADSRVPPELIFDQGLGDLFVVRVAGNTLTPETVGSIEFAVTQLGASLLVVLGHSRCGAAQTALALAEHGGEAPSPALQAVVRPLLPVARQLRRDHPQEDSAVLVERLVSEAVAVSVASIRERSTALARAIDSGELRVVGAKYDLDTGAVAFL